MHKYFAIVFFIGSCYGYSFESEKDILSLPVLDYDDTKTYELYMDEQYNILRREKNQEQKQLDQILKQLCENNDFTLEGIIIDCEKIKITPKVKRSVIKKRDMTEVLEEGSGDDAPEDSKVDENKEPSSLAEQLVPVESAPVKIEIALEDSAPVKPTPEESNKENSAPHDSTSVDSAPVEVAKANAGPVAPVEAAPVDVAPVDVAPVEAAPVEVAPVEVAPVDAVPVEAAPVEAAPVEVAPVDATPVKKSTGKESPVDISAVDAVPVKPIELDSAPLGSVPVEPSPGETAVVDLESSVAPDESKTTEPVSKAATGASESVKETTKLLNEEENKKIEKVDGKILFENVEKTEGSEDKKGRKLTQEDLIDEQTGVAVYKVDAGITETDAKLSKMKTNESMKTASIGGVGESTEANKGGNDNKILITLFVGVLAVGVAAFSYNYIKKKKRNSTEARSKNGVAQSDPEEGSEMKPLVRENSPNVEYKNEKNENVST